MIQPTDLYKVLQVDAEAEPEVIRAAYLCLAKKYHPDTSGGEGDRMAALNEAWAVLGDMDRRRAYDRARFVSAFHQATGSARRDTTDSAVYAPPAAAASSRPASGGTILDFGRYAGWALDAIAREDPDYLEWLARAPIGMRFRTEIYALLTTRASASRAAATRQDARQSGRGSGGIGGRMPWRSRA